MMRPGWTWKRSAQDPNNTSSSVKHGGGGVMVWAAAASGTDSWIFIDDISHDGSSRMNSRKNSRKTLP